MSKAVLIILSFEFGRYGMDQLGKFRVLIRLALIDNFFDQSEKNFLIRLAALENISEREIENLVEEVLKSDAEPSLEPEPSYDEKISILVDLIRVMKVDGKVFDAEVKFCEHVAETFGFNEKAIGFLSGNVNINPIDSADLAKIQFRMRKYLISN